MSFPSCIKVPASKNNPTTETCRRIEEPVTYRELIAMANKVFGHGQWSHSITSQTVDYTEYVMGKYLIGCAAFVRVQRSDGTFHEALGYSNTESSVKGDALFSARSLSITQALKKALLCFAGAIEEMITKSSKEALEIRGRTATTSRERDDEAAAKIHQIDQAIMSKENVDQLSPAKENAQSRRSKREQADEVILPSNSRNSKETNDIPKPIKAVEAKTEARDGNKASSVQNIPMNKEERAAAMTAEEERLERKRKQKQKQEEYKKLMMEKMMKSAEKPNSRY